MVLTYSHYSLYKSWIVLREFSPASVYQNRKAFLWLNNKSKTCCAKNQCGQVLCCALQSCRSSQWLGIHGGEDAVETRQRPGLHTLHPKGQKRHFLLMNSNYIYQDLPSHANKKLVFDYLSKFWWDRSEKITFLSSLSRKDSDGTCPRLLFWGGLSFWAPWFKW